MQAIWVFMGAKVTPVAGAMFLQRQKLSSVFGAILPSMSTSYALADVAALIGEPTRAAILLALLGGRPLPAGALALAANLSAAATSLHLAKLTRGGLLTVKQEGRCRYYQLANDDVAHALEVLGTIATAHRPMRALTPERAAFRVARTCYDHLAGALSVALAQRLELDGMVRSANARSYEVTDRGVCWLAEEMDIDVVALAKENGIPAQYGVTGGGNDGSVFLRYGSVDVALGWPLRYSHSPAEVIDTRDLDALGKILAVLAKSW